MRVNHVLFLCSGNYYRSRYAEIYFNCLADEQALGWRAVSRGLALCEANVGPMSPHAIARLASRSIGAERYQRPPQAVVPEDFARARHVVAVKGGEHRPMVEKTFPAWARSVEFWEVHDLDCAPPNEALPHLEREVQQLVVRLASRLS